jgi:iron complex outermembrane receptor protein
MKDRFSYKFGTAVPNPTLNPERATTVEAGYQGTVGSRTSLQASVFYSRITDLIQRFALGPNLSQQQNIGRVSSAGIEVDIRHRVRQRIEVAGNYTFLNRDNLSAPAVRLTETPRHKGLVSVTAGPYRRLRGMMSVEGESGRLTLNEGSHYFDVPAFAVLHAKLGCQVYRGLDVDVSGANLADRNYWIADGYPEAGRSVRLSIHYRY